MSFYVDVHTHLTHDDFADDWKTVAEQARLAGVRAIVVNGLEPASNRKILAWAEECPSIFPALGIYPLDAICRDLPQDFPFEVTGFDVAKEVEFIATMAKNRKVVAIGECGLDQHYVGQELLPLQEKVFRQLIEIAVSHELPLIIHTRKAEERAAAILREHKVKWVDFHCFGGRTALARKLAEDEGWWFSIPANANKNEAFQKMLKILPKEKILTETDAPYLGPTRGVRNEPKNVLETIKILASLRQWSVEEARDLVARNFLDLFGASISAMGRKLSFVSSADGCFAPSTNP